MARRRSGAASFISGLAGGMALGQQWRDASERNALNKELADIGAVSETAVASGDEAQKAGMDAYNAALSAAETPEARTRVEQDYAPTLAALEAEKARPASVVQSFGTGRNFQQLADKAALPDALIAAREGVYRRHGKDDEADRLLDRRDQRKTAGMQSRLMGIQIKNAETEQAYKDSLPELMKTSRFAQAQAAGGKYSLADSLADNAAFLAHGTKFGKVDPDKWMSLAGTMQKVEEEGYHKALALADAGGDLKQVAKVFNASGKVQFDPASVVSDKTGAIKLRGQDVPTRIIQYKDATGNVQTINTAAELAALGEAKSLLDMHFSGNRDKNDARRLAHEAARIGLAREQLEQGKRQLVQTDDGAFVVNLGGKNTPPFIAALHGIGGKAGGKSRASEAEARLLDDVRATVGSNMKGGMMSDMDPDLNKKLDAVTAAAGKIVAEHKAAGKALPNSADLYTLAVERATQKPQQQGRPGWSAREIQAGRTSAGTISAVGGGVERPVSKDIGYSPDNPIQYSYIMSSINDSPSSRAQAQAWVDGNMLSASKKIAVMKALGMK